MSEKAIVATGIRKTYRNGELALEVLRGVDLSVETGTFCAIMGPSGSGKSTFLHLMGLLDVPDEGEIVLVGRAVNALREQRQAVIRRELLGFIFQSFFLIPGLTVMENIMMPTLLARRAVDRPYLESLLAMVGLTHRKGHRPAQLSGGEQQRVAIARALANRPPILLADEPTGNLDSENTGHIMALLHTINRENGTTMVMVTHSPEVAQGCNRIITMRDGRIQRMHTP